ncbi:hypothetical protein PoB_002212900 [Plakobranchus ocellatus]|uniref:Uncharacterized protein n=1 Tax=Plakobranchus ocellatus TaxID=259542 RepID=A0AAV3ZJX2_9GAST|nr:hypothetical protein PoB_002212900 [Plakobranchus ocellatus]
MVLKRAARRSSETALLVELVTSSIPSTTAGDIDGTLNNEHGIKIFSDYSAVGSSHATDALVGALKA